MARAPPRLGRFDSLTVALRELREDTGLEGAEGVELGSFYPDTWMLADTVDVVDELVASSRVVDGIAPRRSDPLRRCRCCAKGSGCASRIRAP